MKPAHAAVETTHTSVESSHAAVESAPHSPAGTTTATPSLTRSRQSQDASNKEQRH